jgi:hypothetical protein
LHSIAADVNVGALAMSDSKKLADDSVEMKHIFSQLQINELDIADGLKELLYKKKNDLNSILQSDAASLADKLGIEEYVAKIIINAAKKKETE